MSLNWEEIKNRLDKENEARALKKRDKGFEKEVKRRETGYQAHCTGTWQLGVEWLNSLEPIKEKSPPPDSEQRKNLLREKWEELQRSKS